MNRTRIHDLLITIGPGKIEIQNTPHGHTIYCELRNAVRDINGEGGQRVKRYAPGGKPIKQEPNSALPDALFATPYGELHLDHQRGPKPRQLQELRDRMRIALEQKLLKKSLGTFGNRAFYPRHG